MWTGEAQLRLEQEPRQRFCFDLSLIRCVYEDDMERNYQHMVEVVAAMGVTSHVVSRSVLTGKIYPAIGCWGLHGDREGLSP